MALPDYATTNLPDDPLVDSWSITDAYLDNVVTDMAGGNKRSRRFPGDDLARYSFDIKYTLAQFQTFEAFVKTTLGLGTSRFLMRIWTGSALEEKTVQFAGKYKIQSRAPLNIIVSFDLWVYPSVVITPPDDEEEGIMDFSNPDNSGLLVLLEDI